MAVRQHQDPSCGVRWTLDTPIAESPPLANVTVLRIEGLIDQGAAYSNALL